MKIEIKKLTKVYGRGHNAVLALNELDLEIATTEICIVRGPNGSGKTTLISILSGDLLPTTGSIKLATNEDRTPNIAVVSQFNNLIDELTIREHFELLAKSADSSLVPQDILDLRPAQISRGQSQMVAIALTLTPETDLLLADEPTGALGHEDSAAVYQFIRQAAIENAAAVILVTHDSNAEQIADRVVRLQNGRISETWKPGTAEQQVVNDQGWLKLPSAVHSGLADEVAIEATPTGATLTGRLHDPDLQVTQFLKREPSVDEVLRAEELTTRYGNNVVSAGLNFRIASNSIFSIYGKSGSGKTTLLKTLCGLHKQFDGDVFVTKDTAYFNIDYLYGLELALSQLPCDEGLMSRLQLADLKDRTISTYSGGQKQRALVALALSSPHGIVVLDEPTSALDDEMADLVIQEIVQSQKTIIVATHDERLVEISNDSIQL